MVLETAWHTPTGWLVVTDALVLGPWRGESRSDRYQRVPSDRVARGVLVRTATCIDGRAELMLNRARRRGVETEYCSSPEAGRLSRRAPAVEGQESACRECSPRHRHEDVRQPVATSPPPGDGPYLLSSSIWPVNPAGPAPGKPTQALVA